MSSSQKIRLASRALLTIIAPSTPILIWYKNANDDRQSHTLSVQNKIRVPNVQTIDDLMVEKCLPGDVILFDRRCDRCAAGPLAALTCMVNRQLLCDDDDEVMRAVETGKFDHCGLVVPGRGAFDPVMILESTPGEGMVARPLLTRLEMSRSRTVTLLPLSGPGERRNDESFDPPEKMKVMRERIDKDLKLFMSAHEKASKEQRFENLHSLLSIVGAVTYALGLQKYSPSPVSASAWLTVCGLQSCGVAENITGREALDARVEDFLRDGRFHEKHAVKLRPGWKFLRPVTLRETSRS